MEGTEVGLHEATFCVAIHGLTEAQKEIKKNKRNDIGCEEKTIRKNARHNVCLEDAKSGAVPCVSARPAVLGRTETRGVDGVGRT